MKLLLVAAAVLASVADAEKCVYATVAPNLHSLANQIAKCMTATGNSYNLARAEAPPTPEQATAICSKCGDFVDAVNALPPWPDCTLDVGGSEQTLTSYFDKMIGGCKSSGGSAAAATPSSTTAAPTTTTTSAPAAAGSSGSQESSVGQSGSTSGSSKPAEVTTAPVSSTPVPSPTSSAVSVVGSGLVATAVAISFVVFAA